MWAECSLKGRVCAFQLCSSRQTCPLFWVAVGARQAAERKQMRARVQGRGGRLTG